MAVAEVGHIERNPALLLFTPREAAKPIRPVMNLREANLDRGLPAVRSRPPGRPSQSDRDGAYVRLALSRGEPPEAVAAAIAHFRQGTKPNPRYYAELTVRKAAQSLEAPTRPANFGPDR